MPRVLADGKTKYTILTEKPADPEHPTAVELNGGIDLSCKVLASDFAWTTADSEVVAEPALCDDGNAEALARTNFNTAFSLWRYYLDAGGVDATEDAGFAALREKGATLWGYARKTDKEATEDWAAGDDIQLGAEFTNDWPQDPGAGGWSKVRVPCKVQRGWPWTKVAGA